MNTNNTYKKDPQELFGPDDLKTNPEAHEKKLADNGNFVRLNVNQVAVNGTLETRTFWRY